MFDDEPRGLESSDERSIRHARLVASAVFFLLAVVFILFGLVALANWLVLGDMRLSDLVPGVVITLACAGVGMAFEVRKRW